MLAATTQENTEARSTLLLRPLRQRRFIPKTLTVRFGPGIDVHAISISLKTLQNVYNVDTHLL